jgi:hypothetical protein
VYETKSLRVIVPLGPIARGHILVCSRHHFPNFCAVSASIRKELASLCILCERIIKQVYGGQVLSFEHGVLQARPEHGIHCQHAHRNLVPINDSNLALDQVLERIRSHNIIINRAEGLPVTPKKFGDGIGDYYYISSSRKMQFLGVVPSGRRIPHRILREALSSFLRRRMKSTMEWEKHQRWHIIRSSGLQLKSAFQETKSNLFRS